MPGSETLKKSLDYSSDDEEEDAVDVLPKVDVDVSKLTPLSPEVISKQVSVLIRQIYGGLPPLHRLQ